MIYRLEVDCRQVELDISLSRQEFDDYRDKILALNRQINMRPGKTVSVRPFLVVTPHGLRCKRKLEDYFQEKNIVIQEQKEICNWAAVSTTLYIRRFDEGRLRIALMFEALWQLLFPANTAEYWRLKSTSDLLKPVDQKTILRQKFKSIDIRLISPRIDHNIKLHSFHLPDWENLAREFICLKQVLKSC